jgi:flagellar basal body rod protein FlgB
MSFFIPNSSLDMVLNSLNAVSERQKLSSANLANAHTPGYTAKQVSFADLVRTDNPFETQLSQKMGSKMTEMNTETGLPVDVQRELIEMQKNMLYYSMVSRRASTIFTALRTASQIGR